MPHVSLQSTVVLPQVVSLYLAVSSGGSGAATPPTRISHAYTVILSEPSH